MHDVFISYSTKDMPQAKTVRDVLEKNGIPCWMAPRDIPGGSNYAKEIPLAIRNCQVFVLILSENAQASNWVVKELDNAVNCGKIIIPLMLEDCPLNDEFNFLLTGAQRYAAYRRSAEVLNTLVDRIRAITGKKPEEPAPVHEETASAEPPVVEQAPPVPEEPKQPVPEEPKKPVVTKSNAAPVVHQAKPQKPKKQMEKIPVVLAKPEKLAALGIPGMALVAVVGFLMGNNMYMAATYPLEYGFGDIILYARDYQMIAFYAITGALVGALLWWEWVRFRNREQARNPQSAACPACGSAQLRCSTFRTRRMTWLERATLLLIPLCMVVNMFAHIIVMAVLGNILDWQFLFDLDRMGTCIMISGLIQGLALGCWLSNMLVRRLRRRKGLKSAVCRCSNCRATFLPVAK